MRKFFCFFLPLLFFLAGCMAQTLEDSSVHQPEGFKKYENPDIYIDEALISGPIGDQKHSTPENKYNRTENLKPGSDGRQNKTLPLEWVAGPDKDTNWQQAKNWVQNLSLDGGGWRMATIDELRTLHQKGDTFLLSNTTGRWVWSKDTKGPFGRLFSFRYGTDKKSRRSQSKNYRAFAVRSPQK